MSGHDRNRPRRTLTLDPAVDAYLGKDIVNAGRLVDDLVARNVDKDRLTEAARDAEITFDETTIVGLNLPENYEENEEEDEDS